MHGRIQYRFWRRKVSQISQQQKNLIYFIQLFHFMPTENIKLKILLKVSISHADRSKNEVTQIISSEQFRFESVKINKQFFTPVNRRLKIFLYISCQTDLIERNSLGVETVVQPSVQIPSCCGFTSKQFYGVIFLALRSTCLDCRDAFFIAWLPSKSIETCAIMSPTQEKRWIHTFQIASYKKLDLVSPIPHQVYI